MSEPQQLGKYEILDEIGRGGFTIIYRTCDRPTWEQDFFKRLQKTILSTMMAQAHITTGGMDDRPGQ